MSKPLSSFVFTPDEEKVRLTLWKRSNKYSSVIRIIDCSEKFIETPNNLELQCVTWSEFKYDNTVKHLLPVLPNSFISFLSKQYTGRVSGKGITLGSGCLDNTPQHYFVIIDEGFNISLECAAKRIHFIIPLGKKGRSQML